MLGCSALFRACCDECKCFSPFFGFVYIYKYTYYFFFFFKSIFAISNAYRCIELRLLTTHSMWCWCWCTHTHTFCRVAHQKSHTKNCIFWIVRTQNDWCISKTRTFYAIRIQHDVCVLRVHMCTPIKRAYGSIWYSNINIHNMDRMRCDICHSQICMPSGSSGGNGTATTAVSLRLFSKINTH